jgi:hypothetical protein
LIHAHTHTHTHDLWYILNCREIHPLPCLVVDVFIKNISHKCIEPSSYGHCHFHFLMFASFEDTLRLSLEFGSACPKNGLEVWPWVTAAVVEAPAEFAGGSGFSNSAIRV